MESFTPIASLVGGIVIGLASAALMLVLGRIAGISGILNGLLDLSRDDLGWRAAFVGGLLIGGAALWGLAPETFDFTIDRSPGAIVAAGLLVGFGTRLGGGCTSGHGICGLGRLSPRSTVAVLTFMATGFVTAAIITHGFGGVL